MRPLRLALTADPYVPVPPVHYGGIERVLAFLVEGLHRRGHEVMLWAHPASRVPATVIPYGAPPHTGRLHRLRELAVVSGGLLRRRGRFDLVHSFSRLAALLPAVLAGTPGIQSYQREITSSTVSRAARLAGSRLHFTACGEHMWKGRGLPGRWSTIHNGVDLAHYTLRARVPDDAPLVFLGRIEPIKGTHVAIAVARATGRRLVIAGNVPDEHRGYFDREVAPHLSERVTYVGPVDDRQKNELLGSAWALLMPISWEEPFGIVMAEAMACGTPVLGTRRGSVPEVVEEGVTGFVCDTVEEMAKAVDRVQVLDRSTVRRRCEARFGAEVIVGAYEALYYEHLTRNGCGPHTER